MISGSLAAQYLIKIELGHKRSNKKPVSGSLAGLEAARAISICLLATLLPNPTPVPV